MGAAIELSRATIAVLMAHLAGGVILDVLESGVSKERRSRFWAFTAGMAGYAVMPPAVWGDGT